MEYVIAFVVAFVVSFVVTMSGYLILMGVVKSANCSADKFEKTGRP